MAWIESHEDIGLHPKTINLSVALKIEIPHAVGILHLLWHFTLKFAWQNGNLERFTPQVIARSIQWNGDADDLIHALQESGWLNEMVVHDWLDYAGKIVNDRLYNKKRRKTASNDVNPRKSAATVPNRTVPNLTKEEESVRKTSFKKPTPQEVTEYGISINFTVNGHQFCDFYEQKGWKVGTTPMKDWKAAVRTWKNRRAEQASAPSAPTRNELPCEKASVVLARRDAIEREIERKREEEKRKKSEEIPA